MDQTLTVLGTDVVDDGCPHIISNTTVGDSPFECASNNAKLTQFYTWQCFIKYNTFLFECDGNTRQVYNGFYEVQPGQGD